MGHRYWGRIRACISPIAGVITTLTATIFVATVLLTTPALAFDDADLFLLDIHADGYLLAESVPAYKSGNHYLIDFPAFLEAVEFPIDYQDKTWSGWFRTEDTQFSWNIDSEIAEVTGREGAHVDILQWIEDTEGFFVSTDMLGVWFNLQLSVDPRLQTVTVSSDEPLPFQDWQQRSMAKYRYRSAQSLDADIVVPDQYHWATMPLFNLSTQHFVQKHDGTTGYASTGSMVVGMDLLKHSVMYTGTLIRSDHGDDTESNSTHRLTIERAAPTPDSTLFAGANRYMLGDIYQGTANLVVNSNTGRGFAVGRFSAGNAGNLNLVSIVGDAPPGWQVELYRNGILLEFDVVGTDGRYVFPDQDVPFGENIFVAKLFGPQGQIREDRQTFWGGGIDLDEGDYDYSVSHVDFDQYAIDGRPENASSLPATYATDFRASRAWTDDIQAGAAFTRAGLGNRDRDGNFTDSNYVSLFGRMKLGPGVFVGEASNQLDAGQAWSLEYLTGRNGHSISVAHRAQNDYESPATLVKENVDSVNEVSFFGPFGRDDMNSYTVRLRQRNKADGTSDIRLFNRLGTRVGPVSLSNDFEHIAVDGPDTTNGRLRVAGRVRRISLRGELDYQLSGSQTLQQIAASMNWDVTARLNNNLIVTRNLGSSGSFYVTNLLSVGVRNFDLTFSVSSNMDDAYQVGAGLNIAFGYDKRRQSFVTNQRGLADTGRAAMNLFIDENNNGIRESEEPAVPWARYRDKEMLEESPGTVSLSALPRYQPVTIETRHFKFDDPFLVPRSEIYELYTHAGSDVSVDIAVVMTGDIEGYLYHGQAEDAAPAKGVVVTLYDSDGREISATRSEFDGFYSFTAIPAGEYEVRVQPKAGDELHAQPFTLDGQEGFVALEKIYLYE
jgi:hypothetical protein